MPKATSRWSAVWIGLAVAAAAATWAGCDKQGARGPGGSARPKLAGIVFQEDQFFRLVVFGMQDAARKGGAELFVANHNNRPEREIELINTYIARKVDAIIITPTSAKGSLAALKKAHDKGIAIIVHNTPVDSDLPAAQSDCSPENLGVKTGQAARKYITEKMGGKANIAILGFRSQLAEQSDARTNGFKKQLEGLDGVKIVAEQDAWLPEMAVRKVGDILTAHPEVDLVWSANEGGTVGSVLAVRNAGKAGKIVVFGTDASEQLLSFLQADDNVLQAITSQRPVEVGEMAVQTALKVLRKEPFEKRVSLKGILLSRTDPAGVKAFEKQLKEWIARGS